MKTNYILIDFENVQPDALSALSQEHFRIIVFVGANQAKIPFDVVAALQPLGTRVEYIRISSNGANALDFHIAFYIGNLAAHDSEAYFHIISKDTGFDPLIQHLKTKKIRVCRSHAVTDVPMVKSAMAKSTEERLDVIVASLKQQGQAKPRTITTLSNAIQAVFQKQLADEDVTFLVQALQTKGVISINDTKVAYA